MKKLSAVSIAVATALSVGPASANLMYIDLGTIATSLGYGDPNHFDATRSLGAPDANTRTANFQEFGFNQILATSIYDLSDASIFGSFYDTNIPSELTAAGIPASGLALDGVTTVNLLTPNCPLGQCDIDGLSPLVPPLETDNEGFLQTWDLQVAYHLDGTLTASGPQYTGGTFNVYFRDKAGATQTLVMSGTLTGSTINLANLDLFFSLTSPIAGFLFVDNGSGTFLDAKTSATNLHLDTNVNPPIPTQNQLLMVSATSAARQTTLDGSITASIPEPSTLALLGAALFGFGAMKRRVRS